MNPKVLVIDDSMMVRQQVKRALAGGFEIVEAQDGVEALEKASQYTDFSLVICDVNMPRMNGLDFLEEFRKNDSWKEIPAVMLTTEAQPALVQRAKALDAKGWIVKPFKPELLMAAAKKLMKPAA